MKTDTLIMTYNSAKYLDECLRSVVETVPINRLIAVDHYSTDGTVPILKKYGAEVHQENVGLGYARQVGLDLAKTEVITFIDSDMVFRQKDWWHQAFRVLQSKPTVGAVVARIDDDRIGTQRMKYSRYWWNRMPKTRKFGMTTGSTLMRLEHLKDFRIPSQLDAREDRYIEINLLKKGLTIEFIFIRGTHYFDYKERKGAWGGANTRLITRYINDPDWKQTNIFYLLFRRVLTAFLKAIPPALYYRDPKIIVWNTLHWWSFLQGWINPYKYRKMKRGET